MAKDKKKSAEKEFNKSKKNAGKKASKGLGATGSLLLVVIVLVGIIFLPTSLLLFVGLMPSLVVFFVGGRAGGARASTVVAMNLAGCIPFVFELWSGENDFDSSVGIITDPQTISVIYMAAAFGYLIDWVVTGFVSSFLYQKGVKRMEAIKERQKLLEEHWGEGVVDAAIGKLRKTKD